jgi:hypothetical protein
LPITPLYNIWHTSLLLGQEQVARQWLNGFHSNRASIHFYLPCYRRREVMRTHLEHISLIIFPIWNMCRLRSHGYKQYMHVWVGGTSLHFAALTFVRKKHTRFYPCPLRLWKKIIFTVTSNCHRCRATLINS